MPNSHLAFHNFNFPKTSLLFSLENRITFDDIFSKALGKIDSHSPKRSMFQFFCASEADGISCWHVEICIYFNSMPSRTSLSIQLKTPVQSFAKWRWRYAMAGDAGGKLNRIPAFNSNSAFSIRPARRGNQHTQIHKCLNKYAVSRFRSFLTLRYEFSMRLFACGCRSAWCTRRASYSHSIAFWTNLIFEIWILCMICLRKSGSGGRACLSQYQIHNAPTIRGETMDGYGRTGCGCGEGSRLDIRIWDVHVLLCVSARSHIYLFIHLLLLLP